MLQRFFIIVFLFFILQTLFYILEYSVGSVNIDLVDYSIQSLVLGASIYIVHLSVNVMESEKHLFLLISYMLIVLIISSFTVDLDYLISNIFLLLALHKIRELPSRKVKKKVLFDVSFCISISALYSFEYVFFMTIPFLYILVFCGRDIYNFLIPIVSVGIFLIFLFSWSIIKNTAFSSLIGYDENISKGVAIFDAYHRNIIIALSVLVLANFYVSGYSNFQKIRVHIFINIIVLLVCTWVWINLGDNPQYLLLLAFPTALMLNYVFSYIKSKSNKNFLLIIIVLLTLFFKVYRITH